ncbi:MAG: cyclic nucleotide-binding domain-containing protein [Motiliproteus sp.]
MLFNLWKRPPPRTAASEQTARVSAAVSLPFGDAHAANDVQQMAVTSSAQAFPTLGEKELLTLFKFSNVRKLAAGEVLYRQTDPVDYFYLVIKGEISIAFSLSQESRIGQPAELATIGLLHQIGLTVTELLKQHYPKMIPLIMYLEDTDMGAALLRAWNIPDSVAKTIERQRYPEFAPQAEVDQDVRESVAILYLSQLCYRRIVEGDAADLPVLFFDEYQAVLGWSQESLDSIVNNILLPSCRTSPVVARGRPI